MFMLSTPTKALFIWRCWKLVRREWRRYILSFLAVLYAGHIATSIIAIARAFTDHYERHAPNDPYFISYLALQAALDVSLSCTLMTLIVPSRPHIFTGSPCATIYSLSFITWEALLPASACTLAAFAMYLAALATGRWGDLPQDAAGQMYVVSLFVCLMGAQVASRGRRPHTSVPSLSLGLHQPRPDHPPAHARGIELQTFPASRRSSGDWPAGSPPASPPVFASTSAAPRRSPGPPHTFALLIPGAGGGGDGDGDGGSSALAAGGGGNEGGERDGKLRHLNPERDGPLTPI
ncbi:hypothetical protein DFH11DRAFT_1596908, partial [Phellopilus nigrolimitatus]